MGLRLVQRLAIGGMAELFLANRLDERGQYAGTVVIKTLRSDEPDPERAAEVLRDEGRVGAALQHPGIVRLLDAAIEVERPHLELEFVFGRDLDQIQRRCRARDEPVPLPHVRTILVDLLEALDYAYFDAELDGAPLRAVHLDVSPQNVLVGFDGQTRILDFGLASGRHRRPDARGRALAGKTSYMAPEQILNRPVDHRTDVFAAGISSWELLAHRRLFGRGSDREVAAAVVATAAPWPRCPERPVPGGLAWWTWRALRRRPGLRPRRARAWAAALRRGDPRSREEARIALGRWLASQYREPLERRAQHAAMIRDPVERRRVLDAGFELLPAGSVTEDLHRDSG